MLRNWTVSRQVSCMAVAALTLLALATPAHTMQNDEGFLEPNPAAAKAFEDLVKHYRELPGIEVSCTMNMELEQDGQKAPGEELKAKFVHLKNGDGIVELRGFTCTIKGDTMWIVHESTDHSYYTEKFDDSPYWPLIMKFQDLPFAHIGIFWGEPAMSDTWMQLNTRTTRLVPTVVEDITTDDGRKERQITLSSPDAKMVMHINPETSLIESIDHEITSGQYVRDGAILRSTFTFVNVVYDHAEAAPKIAFDAHGRQRVDFIASLVTQPQAPPMPDVPVGPPGLKPDDPAAVLVGHPAPKFTLPLMDGGKIELEALKGQVVVLDFWAVWCPPCRAALPKLHEAAAWASKQDLPVKFIAVSCWEHGNNDAERIKNASEFWAKNNYTITVAMDHNGATAGTYGVSGIPTSVVIRPDGVVQAYHIGAPNNYIEVLQSEIKEALEAVKGAGGDVHDHGL